MYVLYKFATKFVSPSRCTAAICTTYLNQVYMEHLVRHTGSLLSPFSMLRKKPSRISRSLNCSQSSLCFRRFCDIFWQPTVVRAAKDPSNDQRKMTQASQRRQFISNQEMIHFSLSQQRLASRKHSLSLPIKRKRRNADHVERNMAAVRIMDWIYYLVIII